MDFLSFRGQNLEATVVRVGSQEFVFAPLPSQYMDSATARIYSQQKIEIVPGLKLQEIATGTSYEVLSKPEGHMRQVRIKDYRRGLTPINVTEDELRKRFRFVS